MSYQVQSLRRRLESALIYANEVAVEEASFRDRRRAMRSLHRALRNAVDCDELWAEIIATNATPSTAGLGHAEMHGLLNQLGDTFGEAYVILLVAGGYRHPPPPSAVELLASLRAGFEASFDHAPGQVDDLRARLLQFIEAYERGLEVRNSQSQIRSILGGKRVGAALMASLAAISISVKTGEGFAVDAGLSLNDGPTIEIVVPRPWTPDTANNAISRAASWHVDHQIQIALGDIQASVDADAVDLPLTTQFQQEPEQHLSVASTPASNDSIQESDPPHTEVVETTVDDQVASAPGTPLQNDLPAAIPQREYHDSVINDARQQEYVSISDTESSAFAVPIDAQRIGLDEADTELLVLLNGTIDPAPYLLDLGTPHRIISSASRIHQIGARLCGASENLEGAGPEEVPDELRRKWSALDQAVVGNQSAVSASRVAPKAAAFVRSLRKYLLDQTQEERARIGARLFNLRS